MARSAEVETVEVHDFVPGCYEVVQELLLGVRAGVDFRQGAELGVGAENEIDTGGGPFERARCAIATLEDVIVFVGWLPCGAHVEQSQEEVIGEGRRPPGENAVLRPSKVGVQDAHAAHEHRHLGRGQGQ